MVVVFGCGTNRRTYRRFSPSARCAELGHGSNPEADLCLIGADEGGVVGSGVGYPTELCGTAGVSLGESVIRKQKSW